MQAAAVRKAQSRKERERERDKMAEIAQMKAKEMQQIHNDEHNDGYCSDESEFVKEVELDSRGPTPLKTGLENYYEELSNEATPSQYYSNGGYGSFDNSTPVTEEKPQNFTTRPFNRSRNKDPARGSQEALQRIIDDLKDAAARPYDSSSGSHTSPSSGSSRERNYPYDYSQLARWGIIEPSNDDTETQYALPRHSSISSGPSAPELKVLHPSIFKITKSCELISVVLDRYPDDDSNDFGLQIFESVFSDQEGRQKGRRPIFRSPSGRRPVLGRRKGAFQPVSNNNDGGIILSLIAVDEIRNDSSATYNKKILEGDYFVEVG